MDQLLELSDRMVRLFLSNPRSSGRWEPGTGRMYVEYLPIDEAVMDEHLEGTRGCGGVPIQDEGTCTWGAIDIDNHGEDHDIPIADIDRNIRTFGLPLIACRSKSGGVHAYLFLTEPAPAAQVRELLTQWATKLGYAGCEVFPKQSKLYTKDGKKAFGNWINFPYFRSQDTERYAFVDGKKLDLPAFVNYAESIRVTKMTLRGLVLADHPNAPPCIQKILTKGVAAGQRNEAMYNVAVYFRKRDPSTAQASASQANQYIFDSPLQKAELTRTVNSAMKPDYSYRCGEDVLKSNCNREECLKREYGITPGDVSRIDTHESLPVFGSLTKYLTEPVRWELEIEGVRVFNIGTAELLDWRYIRQLIADRLTRVVPLIKPSEWERILGPMMQEARIVEAPDDASVNGIIRDRLREFAAKTDLHNRGEDPKDRDGLLRGLPVVQKIDGERCVLFRGQDFVNYLKRTKSEELKGANLFFAVKELGVSHRKVRVGAKESCNVWYLPVRAVVIDLALEPVKFKTEL